MFTERRRYLEIQPADEPLCPETVRRSITDLHTIHHGPDRPSRYPTYEFLVVATGQTDDTGHRSLSWYVGSDTATLADVRRTLKQCLPGADVRETEQSYAELLELPIDVEANDNDPQPDHTDQLPARQEGDEPRPDSPPLATHEFAGVEYHGLGARPADWQCPLEPMASFEGADGDAGAWPLARLVDCLATGTAPALVQLLVRPKPDYTPQVDARLDRLADGEDLLRHTVGTAIADMLSGTAENSPRDRQRRRPPTRDRPQQSRRGHPDRRPPRRDPRPDDRRPQPATTDRSHEPTLPASERRRLEALQSVDANQSFTVNVRAIAVGTDADDTAATLRGLPNALEALGTRHYRVVGSLYPYGSLDANRLLDRVLTRDLTTEPTRLRHKLPLVPNRSRAIVADPAALGGLCLTSGPALDSEARRALEPTPTERTGIELPPRSVLTRYLEADGMAIGTPRTADRDTLDATLSIPPAVQQLHTGVFGASGAGKSALAHWMLFENHHATAGADIFIDHKGGGSPEAYLRAHFAEHRDLEAVYHFDCEELLPALPVLSIAPQLAAGINRVQAVEDLVDRHLELLAGYMGAERFHGAPASVEVIELLLKALFDPVHGADATSQYELLHAAARMHHSGEPPAVSDPELRERLTDVTANSDEVFDSILNGAIRRITKATTDARLRPLFAHAADEASEAAFDFLEHLDEDCVIILDTSAYRDDPRQLLTLLVVGELWTALQRRSKRADPHADLPQVNLYLEEAADVTTTSVLTELLSQGRSFGIGVTVMMQFPAQVREANPRVYRELINDIGTHVTGPVNDPAGLATAFATGDIPADEMATRIGELSRGEWLVRPAAAFGADRPTPFVCESLPLLAGHPDGDDPLGERDETTFQSRRTLLDSRMSREHGLAVPETVAGASHQPREPDAEDGAETAAPDEPGAPPITDPIPHSVRLPDPVTYRDEPPYPLVCRRCETRYASTADGMHNAIACCHDIGAVDRDDVPICLLDLALTPTERRDSDYTDAQLRLLAAVYMAHQQRFDALEYDIVWDSMVRLQEYVGIDTDGVEALREDGLLTKDCRHPHVLYTVTPEGRDAIQVGHREGVAHGNGKGDLSESSLHVALVEAGARYLRQRFVDDPDSAAVAVKRYHEVDDGRLDVVALDDDGAVVAALEAELSNNDTLRAVPADFDKMAACDPAAAIWIVKNRDGAHEVLQALNDPPEGDARVAKTYSENMAPQDFKIDTPGLTDVYTFQYLRGSLLEEDEPRLRGRDRVATQ